MNFGGRWIKSIESRNCTVSPLLKDLATTKTPIGFFDPSASHKLIFTCEQTI